MTPKITLTTATLALGLGFGAAAQAETVLTVSSWVPQTHFIYTDILVPYAESIATATEGRVTLNIMPAPLGAPPQHFELARTGVADITWGNFTYEPERFTAIWFAEFPFVGTDAEASSVALWRTFEAHLADNAAFDGVEMLGVGLFGGGQIHHGEKPVITPEDMANQKVRIGGPIQARIMEALGAVPVAAPATKAYELLEGGVIDASLHSVESVMNFRLEESLKQHTIVPNGLYDSSFFIVMNKAKWQSLDEADRTAIAAVSGEALSRLWGQQFNAQHEKAVTLFTEGGHSFNEPSDELMAAITAVSDEMAAEWAVAASAMVALTFADVIGRRLLGTPIFGAHDLTEHLMGLLVFTGLPLVTLAAMHLKVDLFDKFLLHPRLAWWLKVTVFLMALVFALMAWTLASKAIDATAFSEVSQGLNIPRAPLYGWMAVCAALSALAALYTAFAAPMSVAHDQEDVL